MSGWKRFTGLRLGTLNPWLDKEHISDALHRDIELLQKYMKVFHPTVEKILTMTHEQWLIVDEEEMDAKFEAPQKKPVQPPAPATPINLHAADQSEKLYNVESAKGDFTVGAINFSKFVNVKLESKKS